MRTPQKLTPENLNNHKTDRPDIYLDKPKPEVQWNEEGEQETRKTELWRKSKKMENQIWN